MKLWTGILFCLCMNIAAGALAAPLSKDVQVDVTMEKITTLIKAGKDDEALPYFAQLEAMDTPLPESFYFYYIQALEKSGDIQNAQKRAETYLNRYGKKGKYYSSVVPIMGRISIQADKLAKEKAIENQRKEKEYTEAMSRYNEKLAEYEKDIAACPDKYQSALQSARNSYQSAQRDCQATNRQASCEYLQRQGYTDWRTNALERTKMKLDDLFGYSESEYCDRYTKSKPTKPTFSR